MKSPENIPDAMKIEILRNKGRYTWAFFHGKDHEHIDEGRGNSLEEVMVQILAIKSILDEKGGN